MKQHIDMIGRSLAIVIAATLAVPGGAAASNGSATCLRCCHTTQLDNAVDDVADDACGGCCSKKEDAPSKTETPATPCDCPPACCSPMGAGKLICPMSSPISASLAPTPILSAVDAPQTLNPSPAVQGIFRPPRA